VNDKYNILIVDDDGVLCSVLREGMLAFEFPCTTALSGKKALELLVNDPFEVMVTDITMPGMDGFELTEKAKELKPGLAVIVMTGFQDEGSYDRAIAAGASDFIKKPFAIAELLVRIDRIMRDSKHLAAIRQREQDVKLISREMIAGVQDESSKRIADYEQEIADLKKKLY